MIVGVYTGALKYKILSGELNEGGIGNEMVAASIEKSSESIF